MVPTVLIADVDRELCGLYRRFFSCHGWQVQTFGEALTCLTQLRQDSPQLLILDLSLPWGGADGLLAVMRDDPGLARVPVVLTSTTAYADTLFCLVSPPVVRALVKPFALTALLELMPAKLGNGQPGRRNESRHLASPGLCS